MSKRRDLFRKLAASLAYAAAAQAEEQEPTIYIPEKQSEKDRALLLDFMDEYSFAMLVTAKPSVQITNVPTLLFRAPDRSGAWGKLWWHLAKSNAQNEAMHGPTTVIFRGPHGYISPNWYRAANAVPTWNFAVVHASGTPRRIENDAELAAGLKQLVDQNEARYGGGGDWSFDQLPESYLKGMRSGVVGYEMTIERVEGKFKLGQERKQEDRSSVLEGLAKSRRERDLRALSQAYFRRAGQSGNP